MIKAILIDDEPLARSIIAEYLQHYPTISIVQECGDGFEMLELLDTQPAVIFTTAFDEYAMKAFEAHAVDYLLKPFSKERFDKAVKKWMEQYEKKDSKANIESLVETASHSPEQHNRVVVKTGTKIRIIPTHEIHYLEADDDYVKIHTTDGSYLKKKTMGYFEDVLDQTQFVRVHRSFMVQIQQVTRIEPYEKENHLAILKSGAKVPISKSGYPKLKSILGI